jgi:hypothetical protein
MGVDPSGAKQIRSGSLVVDAHQFGLLHDARQTQVHRVSAWNADANSRLIGIRKISHRRARRH